MTSRIRFNRWSARSQTWAMPSAFASATAPRSPAIADESMVSMPLILHIIVLASLKPSESD